MLMHLYLFLLQLAFISSNTYLNVELAYLQTLLPNQFDSRGINFGTSITKLGDLNGDGWQDLAVGASWVQANTGAVYILFMNGDNNTIIDYAIISNLVGGGPPLGANSFFGASLDAYGNTSLVVGAPGTAVGAVYLLHLLSNGTCASYVLIRGRFVGNGPIGNDTDANANANVTFNGPPIRYESLFGSMVATVGYMDRDDVLDLAVGASDASAGYSIVYILFMAANGTVKSYSTISQGVGGGPNFLPFSLFGSSCVALGDVNGDGVTDLAIGSAYYNEGDGKLRTGAVYICFMKIDGTIGAFHRISEYSEAVTFPFLANEYCGASVAAIGDVNADGVPDLAIGCPQQDGSSKGRVFIAYLSSGGSIIAFAYIPGLLDTDLAVNISAAAGFGSGVLRWGDKLLATAPGQGALFFFNYSSAVTIVPPPVDLTLVYVLVPILGSISVCCLLVFAFLWFFRRKADIVEVIVLQSNLEVGKKRERKKESPKKHNNDVVKSKMYVEHYEM